MAITKAVTYVPRPMGTLDGGSRSICRLSLRASRRASRRSSLELEDQSDPREPMVFLKRHLAHDTDYCTFELDEYRDEAGAQMLLAHLRVHKWSLSYLRRIAHDWASVSTGGHRAALRQPDGGTPFLGQIRNPDGLASPIRRCSATMASSALSTFTQFRILMGSSTQETSKNENTTPWAPQAAALTDAFGKAQTAYGTASQAKAPTDFVAQFTPDQLNIFKSMMGYGTGTSTAGTRPRWRAADRRHQRDHGSPLGPLAYDPTKAEQHRCHHGCCEQVRRRPGHRQPSQQRDAQCAQTARDVTLPRSTRTPPSPATPTAPARASLKVWWSAGSHSSPQTSVRPCARRPTRTASASPRRTPTRTTPTRSVPSRAPQVPERTPRTLVSTLVLRDQRPGQPVQSRGRGRDWRTAGAAGEPRQPAGSIPERHVGAIRGPAAAHGHHRLQQLGLQQHGHVDHDEDA
jgi:hypothetical protein